MARFAAASAESAALRRLFAIGAMFSFTVFAASSADVAAFRTLFSIGPTFSRVVAVIFSTSPATRSDAADSDRAPDRGPAHRSSATRAAQMSRDLLDRQIANPRRDVVDRRRARLPIRCRRRPTE